MAESENLSWKDISKKIGVDEQETHARYLQLSNIVKLKASAWKATEDARLKELVEKNGPKNWTRIAMEFPGRSGK